MNNAGLINPRKKLTMRQSVWIGVVLLACFVVGLWFAGRNLPGSTSAANADSNSIGVRAMPVNVMTVSYVDTMKQTRTFTGTIRARNRSDLGFERTGKIKEIHVDEGDAVSAGTPLAQLDTETLQAQKNAVLARLAQAKSILAELESGPRPETIAAARALRDAALSQFEMAETNLVRRKALFDQGAISTEEFDQSRFGLQTSKANLQSTEEQLAELEAGTRQEKIDAQSSSVNQLTAAADEIEVAISKSTLLAPFSGTITRRYLDPGGIAAVGSPVVRLVESQNLEAWIGLPVAAAAELAIGSFQEIVIDGIPYSATLIAKLKELDPQTRTQSVVFRLQTNNSFDIVSGQLCEIKIESHLETSGFWIPNSALTKGVRGLWSVMALVPEKEDSNANRQYGRSKVSVSRAVNSVGGEASSPCRVEKRDVEVIRVEANRVLVRGTLAAGDRIIMDGVHRITGGQLVEPFVLR